MRDQDQEKKTERGDAKTNWDDYPHEGDLETETRGQEWEGETKTKKLKDLEIKTKGREWAGETETERLRDRERRSREQEGDSG